MIYLYVVGFGRPGDARWFHSFWIKDCAVAEVDREELGSPATVHTGPLRLPLVYTRVAIQATGLARATSPTAKRPRRPVVSRIASCKFSANAGGPRGAPFLKIEWILTNDAVLLWDNRYFWQYTPPAGETVLLQAGDRMRFFR